MKVVIEEFEIETVSKKLTPENYLVKQLRQFLAQIKKMKIFKKFRIKKAAIAVFTAALIIAQNPLIILAQTVPSAPSAPQEQSIPNPTMTPPPTPTIPQAPTLQEALSPTITPTPQVTITVTPTPKPSQNTVEPTPSVTNEPTNNSTPQNQSAPTEVEGTGAQIANEGNGSVSLATGDANNTGNIATTGKENLSATVPSNASGSGATVVNSGNGAASDNSASVSNDSTTNNYQTNSATVTNTLSQETLTGDNQASKNTGGDVNLTTGDANTTGTIMNTLNTNVNGIAIYEFNVTDDHMGDYVLDFSDANCVSGCGSANGSAQNIGNGADSTNNAQIDSDTTNNTFQENDATLTNNMYMNSNSGDNTASKNTGGDTTVTTGDANVEGNVLNFVNNNIDGKVVYAVVNVYGDLIGDIVLPDGTVLSCCVNSTGALNTGNGADSTNNAYLDQNTTNNTNQFNNTDIQNNLVLSADSGDNTADRNTDGSVNVESGDTNIVAQVLNVANTNIVGGNLWLVLVNEAGHWIGKILGAPDGQNFAGSSEFQFDVNPDGEVTVANSGNGADSTNNASANQNTTNNVTQTNNAAIVNNVNLSANTGGNNASKNTGGDSSIKTGDANVIANIVNFVNNNIVGSGKLFVTVVNVFGSWLGDFIGPGQHRDNTAGNNTNAGVGGTNDSNNNQNTAVNATTEQVTPTAGVNGLLAAKKLALKSKILGAFTSQEGETNQGNEISFSEETSSQETLVADSSITNPVAGKKVIHINLALFTPLVPLGMWFILRKRKFLKLESSASAE